MAELDPLSVAVGEFKSAMRTLFRRADEDREIGERRHTANQDRLGELSQSTSVAISELRRTAETHWEKTQEKIEDNWEKTQEKIEGLERKIDEHAATVAASAETVKAMQPTVAAVNAWRAKLAAWGSVAFFILIMLGWLAEAAIKAAVAWAVAKFG
jgi:DNA helicase IV